MFRKVTIVFCLVFMLRSCCSVETEANETTDDETETNETGVNEIEVSESKNKSKGECVDDFVKWCKGMNYTDGNMGTSVLISSMNVGTDYSRIMCVSNSNGTNCTQNDNQWFICSPNGTLVYKGIELEEGSTEGVPDEICSDAYEVFYELDLQDMGFNKTAFEEGMKRFMQKINEEMKALQNQIHGMLSNINWPFFNPGNSSFLDDYDHM